MVEPIRVLTVLGTRPEAIKLFPLLQRLRSDGRFASRLCITGQHRDLVQPVLELAGLRPDHDLGVMTPEQGLDRLAAALLPAIGVILDAECPDWLVVQGDTITALSAALAAYHRRIPVAHVEAGLRSGNLHHPWPEEGNRRMIGSLAALHFAPTQAAAAALRAENVVASAIHVTGNTGIDALCWVKAELEQRPKLVSKVDAMLERYHGKRIICVTVHRRENRGGALHRIAAALAQIAARSDAAVILPLHPDPRIRDVLAEQLSGRPNVELTEPLDYPDFIRLLDRATLILTDSGGLQEEAPALGKPVLVLRETTERPEGIAAGTAMLVGTQTERIVAETVRLLDDEEAYCTMARAHNPYGDGRASERIAEALASRCNPGTSVRSSECPAR